MIIAMVFAAVWGTLQLVALGSLARTVRVRTVLLGLLVGLYACAPLAVLLQLLGTRAASALTGMPLWDLVKIDSYTAGPLIEEVVKLLPLALLFRVPALRRQWGITDHLLVSAAVGSGFGLAEALYSSDAPHQAYAMADGWTLATSIALPFVPSIWTSLHSWLPPAVAASDVHLGLYPGFPWISPHLVWSAIGGFGVGLYRLEKHVLARVVAVGLTLYIVADHMAWNAELQGTVPHGFGWYRQWLPWVPLVLVGAAWWFDRRRWARTTSWPLLACEASSSIRLVGLLRALPVLLSAGPITLLEFFRLRRAAATPSEGSAGLLTSMVLELRDSLDGRQPEVEASSIAGSLIDTPRRVGARWVKVAAWALLLLPALIWFVAAGGPGSAWLRQYLRTPWGAWLIVGTTLVALGWTAWRAAAGFRSWPRLTTLPEADLAATSVLRMVVGSGAIAFGGYAVTRMLWLSPASSLVSVMHVLGTVSHTYADSAALMAAAGSGAAATVGGSEQGDDGFVPNAKARKAYEALIAAAEASAAAEAAAREAAVAAEAVQNAEDAPTLDKALNESARKAAAAAKAHRVAAAKSAAAAKEMKAYEAARKAAEHARPTPQPQPAPKPQAKPVPKPTPASPQPGPIYAPAPPGPHPLPPPPPPPVSSGAPPGPTPEDPHRAPPPKAPKPPPPKAR